MGYTIYIVTKDETQTKKMYDFLDKHQVKYDYSGLRLGHSELSYVSKEHMKDNVNTIGFDYGAISGIEREHRFESLKWMATKLNPDNPSIYYYDGEESKFSHPFGDNMITTELDQKKKRDIGMITFSLFEFLDKTDEEKDKEIERNLDFLKRDFNRLDKLWEKLN